MIDAVLARTLHPIAAGVAATPAAVRRLRRVAVAWRGGPPLEVAVRSAVAELPRTGHLGVLAVDVLQCDEERGHAVLRLRGDCPECDASATAWIPAVETFLRHRVACLRSVQFEAPIVAPAASRTERARAGASAMSVAPTPAPPTDRPMPEPCRTSCCSHGGTRP